MKIGLLAIFLISAVCVLANFAEARWMGMDESPWIYENESFHSKVAADGSDTLEVETTILVQKESARQDEGLRRIVYDARSTDFELIEAKTINKDQVIRVDSHHVENKPIASHGEGFDEMRQVTIGFQDVSVGSRLYLHYIRKRHEPALKGYFGYNLEIGASVPVLAYTDEIESKLPLHLETYDPKNELNVEQSQNGKKWHIKISLKRPIFRRAIEEEYSIFDPFSVPQIAISSTEKWEDISAIAGQEHEKILQAELPDLYKSILKKAQDEKTEVDQIDAVTTGLQTAIRYVGDWKTVHGSNYPRPLAEVARTGFGDCKDFATGTVAILRKLGFEAEVAWVFRGHHHLPGPTALPVPDSNHAIAHVHKDGKEWWIDATNRSSFAKGAYEDIANRKALLILPEKGSRLDIPELKAEDDQAKLKLELSFGDKSVLTGIGEIDLLGRAPLLMTASSLSFSKQQIEYSLIRWLKNPGNLLDWSFTNTDFTSRINKDFKSKFTFHEPYLPIQTSDGEGYNIGAAQVAPYFYFRRSDRQYPLALGNPSILTREVLFKGRPIEFKKPIVCSGTSKWIDFSRSFERRGKSVVLVEETKIKKDNVGIHEIQTDEFAALQGKVQKCLGDAVIIFRGT